MIFLIAIRIFEYEVQLNIKNILIKRQKNNKQKILLNQETFRFLLFFNISRKKTLMKDSEAKLRFIELRARGASYDSIAVELKKSKSTLVQWSRELEKEIQNQEFFEYQLLLEQHKLTKKARTEYLCEMIGKINDTLKTIDISKLTVKELITLLDKYEKDLNNNLSGVLYHTGEMIDESFKGIFTEMSEITEKLVQ